MEVAGGLGEVGGAAEVAPVVFVGAEGEDFFTPGGEPKTSVDDGEDAGLSEHGKEARGDDVDAGEGERKWRVASSERRAGRRRFEMGSEISRFVRYDGGAFGVA